MSKMNKTSVCMCLSGHSPLNFHVIFIQSSLFREREFSQTGVAASAILIFTNLVYINTQFLNVTRTNQPNYLLGQFVTIK